MAENLRLVITLVLLASLLLEAKSLVEGIVQLGVGVGNLLLAHESLKTLAEALLGTMVLGKRAHHLGVLQDEGGVDAGLLDELARELVNHASVGERWWALNTHLLAHSLEERIRLVGVELLAGRELLAGGFLEGRNHLDPAPWGLPVDRVLLAVLVSELGDVTAGKVLDERGNKLLGDIHEVVHIGVRPVELNRGELGVVCEIDALVAEVLAHLEDLAKLTDNHLLEEQLRGDSHVHVDIEIVVMSDEWQSGSTASNGVHHGRLNLNEATLMEDLTTCQFCSSPDDSNKLTVTDIPDHPAALPEGLTAPVVPQHIKISHTRALLSVGEGEAHAGKHVQARAEKLDLGRKDGQLALLALGELVLGVGTASITNDTNHITTADVLVLLLKRRGSLGDELGLAHNLDLGADALGIGRGANI